MLTSINLKNFRGFKNLSMAGLARVNLITGKNNTGKTALLEGIYLCCGYIEEIPPFYQMFRSAAEQSGIHDFSEWLLHNHEDGAVAEIHAALSEGDDRAVYLSDERNLLKPLDLEVARFGGVKVFEKGAVKVSNRKRRFWVESFSTQPSRPTSDASEYITAAKKSGGEEKIERLLREVESRLKKVRAFQIGGSANSLVYADIGLPELIPVTQLGQGFNRLLRIYSTMLAAENPICLIDEIENGLHHSVLREVWKGIAALARQENVQIFATTHSWECAVAAHEVFRESEPYDFALHRLERVNGEIQALTYDRETLDAVEQLEMEVR